MCINETFKSAGLTDGAVQQGFAETLSMRKTT
jgi:hypothetical protein